MSRRGYFQVATVETIETKPTAAIPRPTAARAMATATLSPVRAVEKAPTAAATPPAKPAGMAAPSANPAIRALDQTWSKLTEGAVQEIDPGWIDDSFIADRLDLTDEGYRTLVTAIREQGQQVPIMVRPHPEKASRYQVVYGRRRLRAARELGLKVKTMVRDMDDTNLVIVQGQENSVREDLSFIERAFFALRLEDKGFSRETIQSSLSCNKGMAANMIGAAKGIPADLIQAIGSAHGVGRPRWLNLVKLLKEKSAVDAARAALEQPDFAGLESKSRFGRVARAAEKAIVVKDEKTILRLDDGSSFGTLRKTRSSMTIVIDAAKHPEIAAFLATKLPQLVAGAGGGEVRN
jgi:ParB family chromosome partitioning protein